MAYLSQRKIERYPLERDLLNTGIYLHFPYCLRKCGYCDFFSIPCRDLGGDGPSGRERLRAFVHGVARELEIRRPAFGHFQGINTVYFGGGTASLLPAELVDSLLRLFRQVLPFTSDCEITLEGNPEQMREGYLRELADCGVNRVNVGLQTFDPETLRLMDRHFREERLTGVLEDLARSPISDFGIDLIYGFPGRSADNFFADLERVLRISPAHLSLYALTAEIGTPYERKIGRGVIEPPDEIAIERVLNEITNFTRERGYTRYEVSNFCRPGKSRRHNLRYWMYEATLALGPGAHGFTGLERYQNADDIERWERNCREGVFDPPFEHRPLLEVPLSLLRILWPIHTDLFRELFEEHPASERIERLIGELLHRWVAAGYASFDGAERDEAERDGADRDGAERILPARTASGAPDIFFRWNESGILWLDERILEMAEILAGCDPANGSVQKAK